MTDSSATNVTNKSALDSPKLDPLLLSFGIASQFIEFSGNVAQISPANRLHMLNSMGVVADSATAVETLLQQRESARHTTMLPPVYVLAPGDAALSLQLPGRDQTQPVFWQLELEDKQMLQGRAQPATLELQGEPAADAEHYESRLLWLQQLPIGYHQLTLQHGSRQCHTLLIVAPPQIFRPDALLTGKRLWGLSVQLYSVRSDDNWGMGDFADLLTLTEEAADHGASFVLLNPLHYLDLRYPDNASPYSPSDRRYLNPLYIAPALCEDFTAPAVQHLCMEPQNQQQLAALRATANVDYDGVAALKLPLLALMYEHFREHEVGKGTQRAREFETFRHAGGDALTAFASMQAGLGIRPEGAFGDADFHVYLQWVASLQLDNCQQLAMDSDMVVGLVRDLAVGSSSDGCEVRGNPGLFCDNARIGAPPDNFNPLGQNWGLPPLLPEALVQQRFSHFIRLLQSNMQSCGALRIDHVMSLMRLWWCPNDGSNADGAYVHYPVDVMFAILRLESVRNRCLVIGEDLGVVPPEIRSYLDPAGIYSNCVFYFEKYDGWHFRKPEHYKQQALAMIANHDVPPLVSWWNRTDLQLRRAIGLIPTDERLQEEQQHRQGEKGEILQWLAEQHLLPSAWEARDTDKELDTSLTTAIVQACGRTASALLSLQLDDLAGANTPVNIPGTSNEYPNWRRKLPRTLSALFADP
ncbi:MAG: 4-alpha-glucanotransferase, partial [Pseudomonadota bacterium]